MRVFHDSRVTEYRSPCGALEKGKSVALALDVRDAPGATVTLRTWIEGVGESLHPMKNTEKKPTRYAVEFTPDAAATVWYHFIIACPDGTSKRYGAADGRFGGTGELRDWEPPSFCLEVYDPEDEAAFAELVEGRSIMQEVVRFIRNEKTAPEFVEAVKTLRERLSPVACEREVERFGMYDHVVLYNELSEGAQHAAKGRLWCASLIQRLLPGVPVPDGPSPDPVGSYDGDCVAINQNATDLRRILARDGGSDF